MIGLNGVMRVAKTRLEQVLDVRIERRLPYDAKLYGTIAYLRRWQPGDVIFDVGANDGRSVVRLMRHLPRPRIFAFEPVTETFQTLERATAHWPNVTRFRTALGSSVGEAVMYLDDISAMASLHAGWNESSRTETVPTTTLDRFMAEANVSQIHLLKIDAEGHDLEVLKGAQDALGASRISLIQVEAGFSAPGKPQPSLEEFRTFLEPFGYYLYGIYNQSLGRRAPADGAARSPEILVYCDALFVSSRSGDLVAAS